MSKEEFESVGYQWADYFEVSKRYDGGLEHAA